MNKLFKNIGSSLMVAMAITACSPESFDGPDQNGIPSISGVDINMNVDQTVNQATFTVANMPAQTYAVWTVNGNVYSTLNPMNWANNKAGTYDVELRLGNRNGFSQGSISKTFTFENSQVDFTPYFNRIARTWRINHTEVGHMGCGEPGTDGSNWWSAQPEDKADWGVYDDRIIFSEDGVYTYDPGDGGTMYVNTGCSVFSQFNTNDGQDFMAEVAPQTAGYSFDVDGDKILLKLSPETQFPYISSDAQFANPVFTVIKLTNSEMVLLYEGDGITWRFMLTSKEDADAPFGGFKANSDFNMWKKAMFTNDFYYAHGDAWEQNPQPIGFETVSENKYKITLPCESNMQWQAQVKFFTDMSSSAANNYDFSAIFTSTNDIKGATVKLVLHGGGDNDNVFYFADRIDLDAGDSYVFWKSDMPGIDMDKVDLVLDFGGAPAGTEVEVKNVVFKNHADDDGTVLPSDNPGGGGEEAKMDWDYASSANMWKAVDDGSAFDAFGYYFAAGDDWHGIDYEEATHNGDTYELTLPADQGKNQWQGQFHIDTKLTASAAKTYNFYLVMEVDQDCPQVTFKLTDDGDVNYLFEERNDVPAGTYIFKRTGLTLKEGQDAKAIRMFFDFGGSPGGTHVKISKIYFEEATSMGYDDEDNLWKAVDSGSALDALGYYFAAGDDWHGISYEEATHNGNVWELTLPAEQGKNQWQGQFHIDTKLTASAAKQYNFQLEMEVDQDCPGVTIKLTDDGDTNFFCEGRHDIPAGEPYVFTLKNATLKEGQDAKAIRLFFDFGGSPGGTHVKISKIVFKEVQ